MPLVLLATMLTLAPFTVAKSSEVNCLAQNVYHEAGNQSFTGMIAVAHVTINRARWLRESICATIRRPAAFSWFNGSNQSTDWNYRISNARREAYMATLVALQDRDSDPTNGALFFHHIRIRHDCTIRGPRRPFWCDQIFERLIGDHKFYRLRTE